MLMSKPALHYGLVHEKGGNFLGWETCSVRGDTVYD